MDASLMRGDRTMAGARLLALYRGAAPDEHTEEDRDFAHRVLGLIELDRGFRRDAMPIATLSPRAVLVTVTGLTLEEAGLLINSLMVLRQGTPELDRAGDRPAYQAVRPQRDRPRRCLNAVKQLLRRPAVGLGRVEQRVGNARVEGGRPPYGA
jgi:hypothetical protein